MSKLFLLSKEQYQKNKELISNESSWWLRSPSDYNLENAVFVVYPGGLVHDYHAVDYRNGVRPAFKFTSDIFDDRNVGSVVQFGKINWIKLKDGIYLAKDIIFNYKFDNESNDYDGSDIKNKLIECESWWFTEDELSMLENFNEVE